MPGVKDIEDGRLDQHDASYKVGTVLKEMYIDSALKKDKQNPHTNHLDAYRISRIAGILLHLSELKKALRWR